MKASEEAEEGRQPMRTLRPKGPAGLEGYWACLFIQYKRRNSSNWFIGESHPFFQQFWPILLILKVKSRTVSKKVALP
jgi:hypothetical protein